MAKSAVNYTGIIPETGDSFESATQNTTGSLEGIDTKLGELNSGKLESGGYIGNAQDLKDKIDLKAPINNPTFTGTVVLPATTSIGNADSTEISYLDGVTSGIQAQLNNKQNTLISGSNIKTINGESLLGNGDIVLEGENKVRIFDTIADAQAYSGFVEGERVNLLGRISKNDGAGHTRYFSTTDNGSGEPVTSGGFLNYISEDGKIHALHFGLNGNNTFDNTTLDQKMHTYLQIYGYYNTIVYSSGNFKTDYIPTNHVNYEFNFANRINFTSGLKTPSYSDKIERLINNQEYAFAWLKSINSNYSSVKKQIIFAGDSTSSGIWEKGTGYVNNGYGKITDLFIESCKNNGIGNVDVINGAWAGTNASDWATDPEPPSVKPYVEEHIDAYPDMNCYVVRYGLNDAIEGTIEDFKNRMEIGLDKLRTFKSVEDLTIVLMTPNSSFQGNKNEKWLESIIPILKYLAKKYQCVYIDTYGSLKDARSGYNIWNDYIHPDIVHMGIINSLLEEVLIKPLGYSKKITNNFRNIPNKEESILSTQTDFEFGISINRAMLANGFPRDGQVITINHADGVKLQINNAYLTTGISFRNGLDDTWQAWENLGSSSETSAGVTSATGFNSPSVKVTKNNSVVVLDGYSVKTSPSILPTDTEIMTLPVGYSPRESVYTTCIAWDGGALFEIIPISIGKTDRKVYTSQGSVRSVNRLYFSTSFTVI